VGGWGEIEEGEEAEVVAECRGERGGVGEKQGGRKWVEGVAKGEEKDKGERSLTERGRAEVKQNEERGRWAGKGPLLNMTLLNPKTKLEGGGHVDFRKMGKRAIAHLEVCGRRKKTRKRQVLRPRRENLSIQEKGIAGVIAFQKQRN